MRRSLCEINVTILYKINVLCCVINLCCVTKKTHELALSSFKKYVKTVQLKKTLIENKSLFKSERKAAKYLLQIDVFINIGVF